MVGAVIPAVFNTWGGQESGGFFLTRAFEGYNRLVVVALIVLLAAMGYRQWRGEAAASVSRSEWVLLSAMGGIAGLIILVLHPQAAALQAEAFGLKDEQAKKAAFEAFFRLHMPIRSLYVVNVAAGNLVTGAQNETIFATRRDPGVRKALVGIGGRNSLRRARSWV